MTLVSALDSLDRRILRALQSNGRMTNSELASEIGLSESPCSRRRQRLEREGFIAGYRADLSRVELGLGLTVFVGIKVARHHDAETASFEGWAFSQPAVVAAHLVSGDMDFLLHVVVADLGEYETFLTQQLLKQPLVLDIRSYFGLREVKRFAGLPL